MAKHNNTQPKTITEEEVNRAIINADANNDGYITKEEMTNWVAIYMAEVERHHHEEEDDSWYFAIASMMNLISLKARDIVPKESKPGELLDFELIFYSIKGMAAAKPSPGKSFHGVLHKMSAKDMVALDKIEATVSRTNGKARLYDGSIVDVTVYSNPPKTVDPAGDKPP